MGWQWWTYRNKTASCPSSHLLACCSLRAKFQWTRWTHWERWQSPISSPPREQAGDRIQAGTWAWEQKTVSLLGATELLRFQRSISQAGCSRGQFCPLHFLRRVCAYTGAPLNAVAFWDLLSLLELCLLYKIRECKHAMPYGNLMKRYFQRSPLGPVRVLITPWFLTVLGSKHLGIHIPGRTVMITCHDYRLQDWTWVLTLMRENSPVSGQR